MEMETAVLLLVAAFAFLVILTLAVGWLWMMVVAFQTHPGWGAAVLLAWPWGSFAFAVGNWQRARWPALMTLAGFVGMVMLACSVPLLEKAGLHSTKQEQVAPSPSASPAS
jgi:hypothetical protein